MSSDDTAAAWEPWQTAWLRGRCGDGWIAEIRWGWFGWRCARGAGDTARLAVENAISKASVRQAAFAGLVGSKAQSLADRENCVRLLRLLALIAEEKMWPPEERRSANNLSRSCWRKAEELAIEWGIGPIAR